MRDEGRTAPATGAPQGPGHLDSWGEIAARLHRSISTVQRWEKHEGLPVHRIAHSKLGSVYAVSSELDAWYAARTLTSSGPRPGAGGAAPEGRLTLAVLPFQNLSGSADQDYFSDGLTEELITHRVRASAQLVTTSDGMHLWAESHEQPLTGFIAIQVAIAERVADSLRFHLLSEQHAAHAKARQTSPEALDEYLKGRYFWNMRMPEGFRRALDYFQRTIRLDPEFAPAHAGVADTCALLGSWPYGVLAPPEASARARAAAQRALELDPGLAEAHATLGFVHHEFDWDWEAADRSFGRALELNPSYATGHQWRAQCLALRGRSADAIAGIAHARALDPLSLVVNTSEAWIHYLARDYEKARECCDRTLEVNPSFPLARLLLAGIHCFTGKARESLREHDAFDRLYGVSALGIMWRACHQALAGNRRQAERSLAELRHRAADETVFSWQFAMIYASLGAADEAFAALERAFEERSNFLVSLKVEPHWDPLRADPRFRDLLARVGLA